MIEPRLRRHRTHGRRQNLRHLCGNPGTLGESLTYFKFMQPYLKEKKKNIDCCKVLYCSSCNAKTQHDVQCLEDGTIYQTTFRERSHPREEIRFTFMLRNTCCVCKKESYDLAQVEGDNISYTRVYPIEGSLNIPRPNNNTPEEAKAIYEEASRILDYSPRASAALMRLALQQLLDHLKVEGQNINSQIGNLKKQKLPDYVIQYMVSVRIVGNEAVHPGIINFQENIGLVPKLFDAFNYIVQELIEREKRAKLLFAELPEDKRKAVEKRDSRPIN